MVLGQLSDVTCILEGLFDCMVTSFLFRPHTINTLKQFIDAGMFARRSRDNHWFMSKVLVQH